MERAIIFGAGSIEEKVYILTRGKIYQIEYAVFHLILRVIGFEYVGMKLILYCILTKFAVGCKFCYKKTISHSGKFNCS